MRKDTPVAVWMDLGRIVAIGVLLWGCASGVERGFAPGDDHNLGDDSGVLHDGAMPVGDASSPPDAAVSSDASSRDGAQDSAAPDAGIPDAGDAGSWPDGGATCAPAAGALVISEVMIASVAGSTDRGEWFEVHNTGACAVDLAGVSIVSPTSAGNEKTHTVTAGTVAAGDYFVFALSGDVVENHNLPYDYVYANDVPANDVIFNNSNDWLELRVGTKALDRVSWGSSAYTAGKARAFPLAATVASNDDWATSCDSKATYSTVGGMFYGTPGAANAATCP